MKLKVNGVGCCPLTFVDRVFSKVLGYDLSYSSLSLFRPPFTLLSSQSLSPESSSSAVGRSGMEVSAKRHKWGKNTKLTVTFSYFF